VVHSFTFITVQSEYACCRLRLFSAITAASDLLPSSLSTILRILSSSGMLHSVGWFRADVSGLRIGTIFKGEDMLLLWHLDLWRWDPNVDPKCRCETNLRFVTSQKTTQFRYNAAEAYDLTYLRMFCERYFDSLLYLVFTSASVTVRRVRLRWNNDVIRLLYTYNGCIGYWYPYYYQETVSRCVRCHSNVWVMVDCR
jgi:hypothetical protein